MAISSPPFHVTLCWPLGVRYVCLCLCLMRNLFRKKTTETYKYLIYVLVSLYIFVFLLILLARNKVERVKFLESICFCFLSFCLHFGFRWTKILIYIFRFGFFFWVKIIQVKEYFFFCSFMQLYVRRVRFWGLPTLLAKINSLIVYSYSYALVRMCGSFISQLKARYCMEKHKVEVSPVRRGCVCLVD